MTKCVAAVAGLVLAGGLATLATTPARGDAASQARLLGGDPCNAQPPRPSNPQASPVRIGSFNIKAGASTQDFSAGVHAFLPYGDIIGLQETNSKDKALVLANLDDNGWAVIDGNGRTSVPGVWVAGNVTNARAQVITAAGEGSAAGIALNADLVADDVARALAAPEPASRIKTY